MLALATLPNPADMMTSIGVWSSPLFTDLLPFALYAVGIMAGVFLITFLIEMAKSAFGHRKRWEDDRPHL